MKELEFTRDIVPLVNELANRALQQLRLVTDGDIDKDFDMRIDIIGTEVVQLLFQYHPALKPKYSTHLYYASKPTCYLNLVTFDHVMDSKGMTVKFNDPIIKTYSQTLLKQFKHMLITHPLNKYH